MTAIATQSIERTLPVTAHGVRFCDVIARYDFEEQTGRIVRAWMAPASPFIADEWVQVTVAPYHPHVTELGCPFALAVQAGSRSLQTWRLIEDARRKVTGSGPFRSPNLQAVQ